MDENIEDLTDKELIQEFFVCKREMEQRQLDMVEEDTENTVSYIG